MLAVLPRQQTDDIGGELFVEAYRRHLAEWPNEAISYLASESTGSCKWFPTIAECRDILGGWRRSDAASQRKALAGSLAARERNQRFAESQPRPPVLQHLTQDDVDLMNPEMIRIGLACGALERDADGTVRPA